MLRDLPFVANGPPDHGGRNTGPRPMEMLLMGMGSCTAFDILNILDKARAEVTDCVAELDAERADCGHWSWLKREAGSAGCGAIGREILQRFYHAGQRRR